MTTRRLIATACALACLTLGACGSEGEGPDVSLPTSVTLPERSTTVPPETGVTEVPTTETPTTERTLPDRPTTEVPTTEAPEPDEPEPDEPEAEAPVASPQDGTDDSTLLWPWILAGLVVVGLIAFLVMRRSRRATTWHQQTAATFDETTHLATHLAAVAPEGAAMVAAQDARQLADLAARLSALGADAPDERQRRSIASVHDQVQLVHGIVDGIALAPGPASSVALDYLREQAAVLHGAAARARAEVIPGSPGSTTS